MSNNIRKSRKSLFFIPLCTFIGSNHLKSKNKNPVVTSSSVLKSGHITSDPYICHFTNLKLLMQDKDVSQHKACLKLLSCTLHKQRLLPPAFRFCTNCGSLSKCQVAGLESVMPHSNLICPDAEARSVLPSPIIFLP